MPQKTNLNINPYYDDFDKDDNFYRVLFKPGFPVQARELTTLQSILQNQVESFGSHIFKEGSMVIPGNISYDNEYYSVKINDQHLGIDVEVYASQLVGKKIRGQTTGIVAKVDKYLAASTADETTNLTLFVKYLRSGDNNEISYFDNGETLITEETFTYGNTTVTAGSTVASLLSSDACSRGSSVSIGEGVYFIRGTFVNVSSDTIVLDPYSDIPSYRVGLTIVEKVISAKDDNSLYDNAKGFSNYSAPGADRLRITTSLSKKSLTDFDDKSFVELLKVDGGVVKKLQDTSVYNIIKDYIAKRTYDESGNYSLDNYIVDVDNSLNDGLSNGGVYSSEQKTDEGNNPSDDLLSVKVSAGRAYVKGYDVNSVSTTILDVDKPRETKNVSSSLVPFEFGTLLKVNNVFGTPYIGVNVNSNTPIELYSRRRNSTTSGTGVKIGDARVYSFSVSDAPYSGASTDWDLYMFDIQTYTFLTVNKSLTASECPATSFIRGVSSGATGYVVNAASGTELTLTQVSGVFSQGEQILINETTLVSRSVASTKSYGIEDVKSVYQDASSYSGITVDFVADTVLQKSLPKNFSITDTITIDNSGNVTSPGNNFVGIKTDTIIRYQLSGLNTETYNRVSSVSADGLTMTLANDIPNVSDVCDGGYPSTTQKVTFSIGTPLAREIGGLYSKIQSDNVSSVNLSNSNLTVSKQLSGYNATGGSITIPISDVGITSAFFESFDAERYGVFYNDGTVETLTSDQFTLDSGGGNITINGLTSGTTNTVVNVTVRKNGIQNKQKEYVRSEKLVISNTSSGISTNISGLSTNSYYGLRVEDREISLNLPDVVKVIAIHESYNSSLPTLDSLKFPSGLSLNTNSILGEKIKGKTSGAIAQIVTRVSSTDVEFVYLNTNKFRVGEVVDFEESDISSTIQSIALGNYQDITNKFDLDKGQRSQYYDYSRIVRKNNSYIPSHKLRVIFDYYRVPSDDDGDIYTVNSYDSERFGADIPHISNTVRASDTLDFRPRVAKFTSSVSSPFAFASRDFSTAGINPSLVVSPAESSLIGYDFYLPRIDKVVLNKEGNFSVIKGVSSVSPKPPVDTDDVMNIATIEYPAYLYNPDDANITLVDNRRYTMRDIGDIEDRVSNLETLTTLSLLEVDTKTLQVRDADGFDRFKSGFFVDDFRDENRCDRSLSKCDFDIENGFLQSSSDVQSIKLETALASDGVNLLDSDVQKSGDVITLKYQSEKWISQEFASRVVNVNEFNVVEYTGNISLRPSKDTWVRNVYVDGGSRTVTGWGPNYTQIVKTSSVPDPHIRSRNVTYKSTNLKPFTRYYSFFDGSSGLDIIPKLIEIEMVSGVFEVGETVRGYVDGVQLFSARVANSNHKTGPYNNPSTTYTSNPYNSSIFVAENYSASSTTLNIDEESLSDQVIGKYNGYITTGMVLSGETSNAEATVSNIRIITDTNGSAFGSFFIRNPLNNPPFKFKTGVKTFKLTSSSLNAKNLPGSVLISSGETSYRAIGRVDTYKKTKIILVPPPPPPPPRRSDPLAQTFTTDENTGSFLTSLGLYFSSKDPSTSLTVEIRTVELGTPTADLVYDYATVEVNPEDITTSSDASVETVINFPSPIYLESNTEYAVVLLSPSSDNYEVWASRMGDITIETQSLPVSESIKIGKQYIGGSLFKSQNGTIWTASQYEDVKFNLYRANFTSTSGTAYFYNPTLDDDINLNTLSENAIKTLPRKLTIGITTATDLNDVLVVGNKVSDTTSASGPYGYIENVGGELSTVSSTLVGAGYSNATYTNVSLYNITGSGSGAQATVTFSSGQLSGTPTITSGGSGYVLGDVLGITTADVTKGAGAQITVETLNGFNTLYLTNVQGEEFTTSSDLVVYDGATAVAYANTDIISSTTSSDLYTGNVIEVNQSNHGMHSDNNVVSISNVSPNTIPSTLTASIDSDSTLVSVANTTIFATFEGQSTEEGYLKIGAEILHYNGITAGSSPQGTLSIVERGVDGSPVTTHNINDAVYPYELNGVSLRRINTDHNLPSNQTLKSEGDIDKYYLQIDRTGRETGDTQLSFTDENYVGGSNATGSKNIQFNSILPSIDYITPGEKTTLSASIRTVSGTSASGSEVSFVDQGFEPVQLDEVNELDTTRIVSSKKSEIVRLTNLPSNKSFTMGLEMSRGDNEYLSPLIDVGNDTFSTILIRNRLNSPVSNYSSNGLVKTETLDPHESVYFTNTIQLKQPASSLKVIVSAYRDSSADFRVLYELIKVNSSTSSFELFPGYNNLKDTDGDGYGDVVIDATLNNGRPDAFVRASNDEEFLEYQFSADNLEQFVGFRIKIVSSGTNEARAPKFKDLRVIALA